MPVILYNCTFLVRDSTFTMKVSSCALLGAAFGTVQGAPIIKKRAINDGMSSI